MSDRAGLPTGRRGVLAGLAAGALALLVGGVTRLLPGWARPGGERGRGLRGFRGFRRVRPWSDEVLDQTNDWAG